MLTEIWFPSFHYPYCCFSYLPSILLCFFSCCIIFSLLARLYLLTLVCITEIFSTFIIFHPMHCFCNPFPLGLVFGDKYAHLEISSVFLWISQVKKRHLDVWVHHDAKYLIYRKDQSTEKKQNILCLEGGKLELFWSRWKISKNSKDYFSSHNNIVIINNIH